MRAAGGAGRRTSWSKVAASGRARGRGQKDVMRAEKRVLGVVYKRWGEDQLYRVGFDWETWLGPSESYAKN